jgi:hypothetical protein
MNDKRKFEQLRTLLEWHKAMLEQDLRDNDYAETPSVSYGIHQEIDAINVLLENLPEATK